MLRTRWKPSVVGIHSSLAVIPAEPGAPLGQRAISGAWRSIAFGSCARASAQKGTVQSNRVHMTELPHPHAGAAHGDVGHVPGARHGAKKETGKRSRVNIPKSPRPPAGAAHAIVAPVPGARHGDANFHAGVG